MITSSKQSAHFKVDFHTEKALQSYGYLSNKVKLGINNEICFVNNRAFLCNNHGQLTEVYTFKGPVLHWHKSQQQLLFTVKTSNNIELIVLNGTNYQAQAIVQLPNGLDGVFALRNRQVIVEQSRFERDIIKLAIQGHVSQ